MKLFNASLYQKESQQHEVPMSPTAETHETTVTQEQHFMRPLDPREQRAHETLKRIEYWMDSSIPLPFSNGKRRIGLDPILGLIPLVGDFGSAFISLGFVARAAPTLSRYTVVRMLYNVWVDSVIGVIPLVGDIFDIGHKANQKNLKLFEQHMEVGVTLQDRTDRKWIIRVCLLFFLFCSLTTLAFFALFILLILYLTGRL
ncbi:hypothetical protein MPSEU_000976600 [Mayamaea pseudoterrestris]|nr:hypothetical protein MPSEU_000976600 [Mayamaea pseudoterrestris]